MPDQREPWALILGASSGFGEATALALAADGYHIAGVHLDRRQAQPHLDEIRSRVEAMGRELLLFNMNAADDAQRASALESLGARFVAVRGAGREPYVRVLLHSLAFGTLKPFLAEEAAGAISRKNMEMTLDVMA
ncbi:MAG: SDR family NAD(P)-dependent oxidoreductase, partial [Solirubrobacteraceae bacterium]